MRAYGLILVAVIAALHFYIAYFEMFAWESRGPAVFPDFPKELFSQTGALALNQGVYNGFLAVGLIWSLLIGDRQWQLKVAVCFLLFVAVAGIVGAVTASPRILFVQTVPSVAPLALLMAAEWRSTRI
ncbi:MAG: DUF1304 family protein [Boseongicola sp.]|nr:MAG: DUF1304 family protein [Boseongicola sp.]